MGRERLGLPSTLFGSISTPPPSSQDQDVLPLDGFLPSISLGSLPTRRFSMIDDPAAPDPAEEIIRRAMRDLVSRIMKCRFHYSSKSTGRNTESSQYVFPQILRVHLPRFLLMMPSSAVVLLSTRGAVGWSWRWRIGRLDNGGRAAPSSFDMGLCPGNRAMRRARISSEPRR